MDITEIFYSVQGEGRSIGLPTIFIRTAGCNLRCDWCDTSYAWSRGNEMSVSEILKRTGEYPVKRFCVTGGEPLLQKDLPALMEKLLAVGEISLETNGSLDISPYILENVVISMDFKPPSSGMTSKMLMENLPLLRREDQLKFVISSMDDYDYALNVLEEHSPEAEVILQPEGGSGLKTLAERVIKDGVDARVLPQLHKMIWGERRGY